MRKALKGKLEANDALHFHFALGKALEDRDEAEGSFGHYAAGNRIRASQLTPQQLILSPRVDAVVATFTKPLFDRHAGQGDPARDPIFIVGLQRSGSTLIEQILASHPMIEGTSELLLMEQLWIRLGSAPGASGNRLPRWRGWTRRRCRRWAPNISSEAGHSVSPTGRCSSTSCRRTGSMSASSS